jgi:hypothetical protein
MLPSSSLLITSFLTAQTLAFAIPNPFAVTYGASSSGGYQQPTSQNNVQGQASATIQYQTPTTYHESVGAGITPTQQPTYMVTSAPMGSPTGGAVPNWETIVTWPAGCEAWANPCPPGAHISGGSIAGGESSYTNAFTSYTTMTNSEGVITGMPSVATVAAGVSTTLRTATTGVASSGANGTTNGFVAGTATNSIKVSTSTGGAVANEVKFGGVAIVGVAGAALVALL